MDYSNIPYWNNQSAPEEGNEYTDPNFPPNENSLLSKDSNGEFVDKIEGEEYSQRIKSDEIEWKRCSEIFKNQKYLLFEGKIELNDINQGSLGDCYFLASVAALTKYPNLIYNMFKTKEINKEGYFEIIYYIDGKFQTVIIDDYLPVNKETGLIEFARPNKNEIWVCLLEKAWAKVNGGYTNIIKGWMHQVLQTFTGFASSSFNHTGMAKEDLWNHITSALAKDCIIACSSRKDVADKGLVNSHAYTLVEINIIQSLGNKINLVKMRNTWGFKEWTGDWGDNSPLWGEEEKKQVGFSKKDDGIFFMTFDDFYNNFIITDICYVLYNSYSKLVKVDVENMKQGQIFNIYIDEECIFSASIIKKMWRFHRELQGKLEPSTINIMIYDPFAPNSEKMLSSLDGKNSSNEDVSISEFLRPGFYLVYTLIDVANSTIQNNDGYYVKFDSTCKFKVRHAGMDLIENDLPFLRKMHIQFALEKNSEKFNENEKFSSFVANVKKSGIAHRVIYNQNEDKWLRYQENIENMKNYKIISPNGITEEFEWMIPPKSFNAILALELDSNEKSSFALKAKIFNVKNFKNENINNDLSNFNLQEVCNNLVQSEDNSDLKSYYDYQTIPLEKAKEELTFETIDMNEQTIEEIKKNEPFFMERILELEPVSNDKELSWVVQISNTQKYIGQSNKNRKKEGRGVIVLSTSVLIGYFDEGVANGKCKLYDSKMKNLNFDGNYVDGKRNGFGILHFNNGDRYEGNFKNNLKEGEGIYYYKSGASWKGNFTDDKMNGEGLYEKKGKSTILVYENGVMKK
jgi:hypothetical protein